MTEYSSVELRKSFMRLIVNDWQIRLHNIHINIYKIDWMYFFKYQLSREVSALGVFFSGRVIW